MFWIPPLPILRSWATSLVLLCVAASWTSWSSWTSAAEVTDLGKTYDFDQRRSPPGMHHHIASDDDVNGGTTSLRRYGEEHVFWKGEASNNGFGYFRRDRDLGQVFHTPPGPPRRVDAMVLRTSLGRGAVGDIAGAPVYLQFFDVQIGEGGPMVDQNGTPPGTRAAHGWDVKFNRADDYVTNVTYVPLHVTDSAAMPAMAATDRSGIGPGGNANRTQEGHLRYFRFKLGPGDLMILQPERTYAWMFGFAAPGPDRSLALANEVKLGGVSVFDRTSPPRLMTDPAGKPWWGIRREGNGRRPPKMIDQRKPPTDPKVLAAMVDDAVFEPNHTQTLSPTSDGYPDVDTYRVFQFYIETTKLTP